MCFWSINQSTVLKKLIKRKIKEHKGETHNGKEKAAIAKIALNENISINYKEAKKLANYNNRNYAYCHEALEIASKSKFFNNMEYISIETSGNGS